MLRKLVTPLLAGAIALSLVSIGSAVPMQLQHQGRLLDALGAPISSTVTIEFRIYDAQTLGNLLWSETHASVVVADGLFSVTLGTVQPLSADVFVSPPSSGLPPTEPYLEIAVGVEVITPRSKLVASP